MPSNEADPGLNLEAAQPDPDHITLIGSSLDESNPVTSVLPYFIKQAGGVKGKNADNFVHIMRGTAILAGIERPDPSEQS